MPPSDLPFSSFVIVETAQIGRLRAVSSVREAGECLVIWPQGLRGAAYAAAISACHEAHSGKLDTEVARQAFIAAAKEVDIFVREGR